MILEPRASRRKPKGRHIADVSKIYVTSSSTCEQRRKCEIAKIVSVIGMELRADTFAHCEDTKLRRFRCDRNEPENVLGRRTIVYNMVMMASTLRKRQGLLRTKDGHIEASNNQTIPQRR
jgi:hypothetical protein